MIGEWTPLIAGLEFSILPQQLANGILLGSIYALIALGYTMVYGVLRLINFAHGEVFMLGAYTALLVSWKLGFTQENVAQHPDINGSILTLVLLLFCSMAVCGIVGVVIELLAYRPMRNQPRIAALITAIGVSLFLQYSGQLFLPNSPPPSINQKVNPIQGATNIPLRKASAETLNNVSTTTAAYEAAKAAFDAQLPNEESRFQLSPTGQALKETMDEANRARTDAEATANSERVEIILPNGQIVMFFSAIALMVGLHFLVNHTKIGRGMRAASHDFDTASLMGINVNRIVTFTFFIGSALAGAGAMMNATFLGTPLTTFYGVVPGVKAFVAAVLGGIGNIRGALLGGLLMGLAEALVAWAGYANMRDAIAFLILIFVLLFKPGGLLGSAAVEKV
ncbi:MAG: branched-chain amino acid ABC transporter permease [Fimbriimonadaceae bacterium]|nr:branched-chain amino acid ABC transporter permease [Fimbriimonadaceae bacterium]